MQNMTPGQLRMLIKRMQQIRNVLPACCRMPLQEGMLAEAQHNWLENALHVLLAPYQTMGACVAIAYQNRLLTVISQGDAIAHESVVTPQTRFRVASISKLIATLGLLQLVDSGALSLDDDVSTSLGFLVGNPRFPYACITLRQLLTHTAGVRDDHDYDRFAGTERMPKLSALFDTAKAARRNFFPFAPGTRFAYSNLGAGMTGAMLEAVTGMELDAYLQKNIFQPLAMDASFHPQRIVGPMASCYRMPKQSLSYDTRRIAQVALPDHTDPMMHYTTYPGKLMICAGDLLRLLLALCQDGCVEGTRILSSQMVREMITPQNQRGSVHCDIDRGLHVAIAPEIFAPNRTLLGHQGMAYGAICEAWCDPTDGSGVVLLTNGALPRKCGPVACVGQDIVAACYLALDTWRTCH